MLLAEQQRSEKTSHANSCHPSAYNLGGTFGYVDIMVCLAAELEMMNEARGIHKILVFCGIQSFLEKRGASRATLRYELCGYRGRGGIL